jgi:hypothetical protein
MPRVKDITLESKGNSQIKSAGKAVKIFKFTSEQGATQADIQKQVQEMQRQNKVLMNGKYSLSVDLDFREAGWRSSEFQKFNINFDDIELFNIFDYYGEGDEKERAFLEKIDVDSFEDYLYYKFNVYVKFDGEDAGGSDEGNHCLYKCLMKACPTKTLHFWKKPSYLKSCLQLKFDDKIPIGKMPIIEQHANISIRVEGDFTYEPMVMKTTHVNLVLKNGHFTLKNDTNFDIYKHLKFFRKKRYILIVMNETEYYDGEERESVDGMTFERTWFIHRCKTDALEDEYDEVMGKISILKEKTGVDLLEYGNFSSASLASFYDLCLTKNGYGSSPEPLTQKEAQWIQLATTGGIMYSVKNEQHENTFMYDVNSLYPYTLLNMNIPASSGTWITMKTIPSKIDFLFIVKATVEKGHLLFRYNKNNLYTSYDLQNAKTLKLDIELIDEELNCLSYEKSRVLKGNVFFKPFVDYWFKMKQENVPYAKRILNCLWGTLTSQNRKVAPEKKDDGLYEPNGYVLKKMTTCGAKHEFKYEFQNQLHPFKYTYARLKPFLLAKSKSKLLSSSINFHLKNNTVLYSHTDSLITTKPMKFKLNDEMGGWKLEHEGGVCIKNLTSKKFLSKST